MASSSLRRGFTLIELLVVIAIIAVLIGLLVPAVQMVLVASLRAASSANLNQIGMGVHSYYDVNKHVPYNGLRENWGTPTDIKSGSWAYQLLPYIEQDFLYRSMKPVTTGKVITGPLLSVPLYLDPGRGRPGYTNDPTVARAGPITDYALNCWLNDNKNGATDGPFRKLTWEGITDGPSNTILIGTESLETDRYTSYGAGSWDETWFVGGYGGSGRNGFICAMDTPTVSYVANGRGQWGGPYQGGCHFVFCDRSVHTITYGTDLTTFVRPDDGKPNPRID